MKVGPQDGKPESYDGGLGKSGNFTVVGYATEEGQLLYRDVDTGVLWSDGMHLEEFGEDDLNAEERRYLEKAKG